MNCDYVLLLYIFTILVSLYGFALFTWWWRRQRKASSVFIYLTILFLGSVIENSVEAYARFLSLNVNHMEMVSFQAGYMWPMRLIVLCAALSMIVAHMSYRVFFKRHYMKEDEEYVVAPIKSVKVPLIKINGEVIAVDIDVKKIRADKFGSDFMDEKIIIIDNGKSRK
jgi:hypothetical protein